MKLLFGLIGALLGLAAGDWTGAFVGGALGVVAALLWKLMRGQPDEAKAAPQDASPVVAELSRRMQSLEQELGTLRKQVIELRSARSASTASAGSPAAPVDAAVPARAAPALAARAPVVDTATSAPIPQVVPESATPIAVDAAPVLLVEDAQRLIVEDDTPAIAPMQAAATPAPSTPPPAPAPAWATPAPVANAAVRKTVVIVPPPPAVPLRDRLPPFLARWIFGGNTIVKAGVLILFLGLAFLLRYTAERVTVPVEVRYAGVALVGAFLLGLGWRLRGRSDKSGGTDYGLILQGAGIGVFYLTALAALRLSPLLTPSLAFAFMAAVSVLGAVLAVAQDAPWLAYVSVAEGFAAPVLVATGSGAYVPLFSYMAILDAGILAMAWFKAWRPLNLVGAVATFALAGAWAQAHYVDGDYAGVQAFLLLFFLLFTTTGVLFARRALAAGDAPPAERPLAERAADTVSRIGRVDSTLTFGVPLAAFTLQYLLVRDMHWGPAWAASAFALFHILLGGALMRGERFAKSSRYALLGEAHVIVGTIFATLAIPLALEGVWTGATWAIEAAGMYWLGARQRRTYARAFALLVLGAATLRLVAGLGLDYRPGVPLIAGSTLGMAMLAAALCAMDAVRRRMPADTRGQVEAIAAPMLPFAAALAFTALAWMVLPVLWAGAATAWIAFGCAAAQRRLATPVLQVASAVLHVVALTAMTVSLQPTGGPDTLAAESRDLAAALLIGAALLATGWLGIRDAWRAAGEGETPRWSLASSIGLAAGIAVVSASLLFVLRPINAAYFWPWIGVFAMWLGGRLRHPALVASAFVLQLVAGVVTVAFSFDIFDAASDLHVLPVTQAFPHPLVMTLAAFFVGDRVRAASAAPAGQRQAAWWHGPVAQALAVGWALVWWWELLQPVWPVLDSHQMLDAWPNVIAIWLTLTSVAAIAVARWRDWSALGRATLATVPLWAVVALGAPLGDGAPPSAHLGWLAWPLALAWLWVGNTTAGDAAPLPYLPVLNPLEIGQGIAVFAFALWARALPATWRTRVPQPVALAVAGATAFALVTGLVLRACHHGAGIAWDEDALWASTLAQAALSVTWASIGVALMMTGHRAVRRAVWLVGAGLLGIVVAKLFLVELADRGSLYRIVSFIVVGALMLVVGYFAPMPPRRETPAAADDAPDTAATETALP